MNYLCVRRDFEPGHTSCLPVELLRRIPHSERSQSIQRANSRSPLILVQRDEFTEIYRPRLPSPMLFSSLHVRSLFNSLPGFLRPSPGADIFLTNDSELAHERIPPAFEDNVLFLTSDGESFERSESLLHYLGPVSLVQSVHRAVESLYESYQDFLWNKMHPYSRSDANLCGRHPTAIAYRTRIDPQQSLPNLEARAREINRQLGLDVGDEFTVQADFNLAAYGASDLQSSFIALGPEALASNSLLQETVLAHELGHFRYESFFFFGLQSYLTREFRIRTPENACREEFLRERNSLNRGGFLYDGDVMSEAYARFTELTYFYHREHRNLLDMSLQERSYYYAPGTMAGEWFARLLRGKVVEDSMLTMTLAYFLFNISADESVPLPVFESFCFMLEREMSPQLGEGLRLWVDASRHDLYNELRGDTYRMCELSSSP